MKSIIIIVFPSPSHYYPMFGYARHWQEKGYRIIFTGNTSEIETLVTREKFEYCNFLYHEEYTVKNLRIFTGLLIESVFDNLSLKNRYKKFYHMQVQIDHIRKMYNAEKFFFDEHLSYLYFFLRENKENILFLNTKLSTSKRTGVPPLNSPLIATNKLPNIILCELLWFSHLAGFKFRDLKRFIVFLGKDDLFFIKRIAQKNRLSYRQNISENHTWYKGIKKVPTILLAPRSLEYEFSPPPQNESYFLEKISRNETPLMNRDYAVLLEFIARKRQNPDVKIICCSFGTLSSMFYSSLYKFVNEVICRLNDKNLVFIITPDYLLNKNNINENIRTFRFLPLLDFIPRIDLMITHGGLGTIKECLQNNKKMIIYPLQKITSDQQGNGARIKSKKLGLTGDLEKENAGELLIKINRLLERPS